MLKYFAKRLRSSIESSSVPDEESTPAPQPLPPPPPQILFENIENLSSEVEIVADPGLRKLIEEYDVGARDRIRKEYVAMDPCQPRGHNFSRKKWVKTIDVSERFGLKTVIGWSIVFQRMQPFVSGGVGSAHIEARIQFEGFKNQRQSVEYSFSSGKHELEVAYRKCLTSTLKRKFLELLKWYSSECPEVAAVVGMNAPGNNQMIAPKIQKQLVNACAVETTNAILADLGDRWFTLLLDEARDCSVKEQMTVVIRYVNKHGEVIERFMVVVHVATTTTACLKEAIDSLFAKYGLSVARLRGQGYDGASNMSGEFNGLKSLIMKENPYALYVHCFAHQLQLLVVTVAQANQYVCDFMWIVGSIVNTSASSCKRDDKLRQLEHDKKVKLLERGEISFGRGLNQETSLARPGDTRWGFHHSTLCRIEQMWPSVIEVLQNLIDDGNRSSKGLSRTLVERMERYEFVFILLLMKCILAITNHLSTVLQEKDQNIVNAMRLINNVKCKLQKLRYYGWDILLEDVKKFCNTNFIEIINMTDNINSRSRLKRDGKNVNFDHYFHVEIFCEVINIILQEMDSRFFETTTDLLIYMSCLDPRNSFSRFDVHKLVRLAHFCEDDFSWNERMLVEQELETYIDDVRSDERFEGISDLGALAKKMIETMKNRVFPLVYRMIELSLLLPVATATVERMFSAVNIVKIDLRNRIGDEWMNDNLVVYIEKDVFNTVDNELILQRFQNMESRRMQLSRIR
ncbi:zinc finger MYM-type protein 1-like [Zingiber officinale]|uniref:zinc finger MYM-type protein 1-like n=1 Tax=Zingiber officinale TaxID=94328 RepID=UPI001C4DC69B|nr:zinc finger MYM-type protein 1-like [Zingiber officinale]